MASKIHYTVSPEEEQAFISEFGQYWSNDQLDAVRTSSKGGLSTRAISRLPDPDTVDPKAEPVAAQQIVMNPQSTFTLGERPFVLPVLSYLSAAGKQVPPEIQVLKEQYNLYLIKYGVNAKPRGKETFAEVELRLDYPDDKGFLTYSIIPDTEIEERLGIKSNVRVGLDTSFKVTVPDVDLMPGLMKLGGGVELAAENDLIFHWEYKALSARVIAIGIKSSYVEWTIRKPKKMIGSVELSTVICVPRSVKELPITVKGCYRLERGIWWWKRETPILINSPRPIIVSLPQ